MATNQFVCVRLYIVESSIYGLQRLKRTFEYVRLAKIQISLRIRAVRYDSSLGAFEKPRMQFFCMRTTMTDQTARYAGLFESSLGPHTRRNIFSGFSGPEVIKLFSCSTQPSMKFSLLINMKMPTTIGIFIFISREIFMLSYV